MLLKIIYFISLSIWCWYTETHLILYITQISSNPAELTYYFNHLFAHSFGFPLYVTISSVNNSSVILIYYMIYNNSNVIPNFFLVFMHWSTLPVQ